MASGHDDDIYSDEDFTDQAAIYGWEFGQSEELEMENYSPSELSNSPSLITEDDDSRDFEL
jgi:hypothetical protein